MTSLTYRDTLYGTAYSNSGKQSTKCHTDALLKRTHENENLENVKPYYFSSPFSVLLLKVCERWNMESCRMQVCFHVPTSHYYTLLL